MSAVEESHGLYQFSQGDHHQPDGHVSTNDAKTASKKQVFKFKPTLPFATLGGSTDFFGAGTAQQEHLQSLLSLGHLLYVQGRYTDVLTLMRPWGACVGVADHHVTSNLVPFMAAHDGHMALLMSPNPEAADAGPIPPPFVDVLRPLLAASPGASLDWLVPFQGRKMTGLDRECLQLLALSASKSPEPAQSLLYLYSLWVCPVHDPSLDLLCANILATSFSLHGWAAYLYRRFLQSRSNCVDTLKRLACLYFLLANNPYHPLPALSKLTADYAFVARNSLDLSSDDQAACLEKSIHYTRAWLRLRSADGLTADDSSLIQSLDQYDLHAHT